MIIKTITTISDLRRLIDELRLLKIKLSDIDTGIFSDDFILEDKIYVNFPKSFSIDDIVVSPVSSDFDIVYTDNGEIITI